MKQIITSAYTFTPAAKTINFSGISSFAVEKLYAVVNVTANQLIYAVGQPKYGYASVASTTVTFTYDTTTMSATDKLMIIYDQNTSQLVDSTGLAIDNLNSGTGLNALNVAFAGTNYLLSTINSTSVQLASLATFTGTLENTLNQQAISVLITSDQPGTLTIKQYSDAAGTRKVPDIVFNHMAGGLSRSVTLNGNYTNITYKNTGFATTTTLRIDTAYGVLPATTALGNAQVSLDEINGTMITPRPDGALRVQSDPTGLLYDNFETLDTTNTWTIGGTVPPTGSAGNLSVAPGTAANASSYAKSIPTFSPSPSGYLQMADLVALEAGVVTGNQRFWGLGIFVTPTTTVPVTNGSIFEIDSATGNLLASTYSNSIRTNSVQIARPSDGAQHRYAIYYKSSRVYFEIDNILVASVAFPNPQVSTQSTVIGSINGGSVLGTAPVLLSSLIGLADTGRNATKIADGTYPWRTNKVNSIGVLQAGIDSISATGTITTQNLVPFGSATAGSAVELSILAGYATGTVQITGTYTGDLTLQYTVDNINWITCNDASIYNVNSGIYNFTITSASTGIFKLPISGFLKFRITALAAVTGTATLLLMASVGSSFIIANTSINQNLVGGATIAVGSGISTLGTQRVILATDNPILTISSVDGTKTTYSAAITNLTAMATAATDIFTLTGSAAKTIRINFISLTATQTTAGQIAVQVIKRTTANTGGTSSVVPAIPYDTNSAAAKATVLAYTVNPTALGTSTGNTRSRKVFAGAIASASDDYVTEFGTRNNQAIVLRGTSQVLAINLNGATLAGTSFNISIEWTEE